MHRIACLAALLLCSTVHAQGFPAELLGQLKSATVYIIVSDKDRGSSGSGFVVQHEGDATYIVTNHHVVDTGDPPGKGKTIRVVFDSGVSGQERIAKATIVASDPERDLAVLKATGVKNPPKPISIDSPPALLETMPLTAFGFPFGDSLAEGAKNPEITVTATLSLSSIRKDESGRVQKLQIAGNLNPGNSGGPVVAANGKLIGVATSIIRNAGIAQAVPQTEVLATMAGRPGRVKLTMKRPDDPESREATLSVSLIDPLGKIKAVTAYSANEIPKDQKPGEVMAGATKLELTVAESVATGDLEVMPNMRLYVQVVAELAEGRVVTDPVEVAVKLQAKPKPAADGRPRAYTLEGILVDLPGLPLRSKPKASETATDFSAVNRKPESYLDKTLTLEGLSNCVFAVSASNEYEIGLLTEAGNTAENIRILLPKDLALQLNACYKRNVLEFQYGLRLIGKVKPPAARKPAHIFEASELHFLDADGKVMTSLISAGSPPDGETTLGILERFPASFRGKTVTIEGYILGMDNSTRLPTLRISHANTMPVLNLQFHCSPDLATQVASDVPSQGSPAKITCMVEAVDTRKGYGILGVTALELLGNEGKSRTIESKDKITYPSTPPPTPSTAIAPKTDSRKAEPATESPKKESNTLFYASIWGGVVLTLGVLFGIFKLIKKKPVPAKYTPRADVSKRTPPPADRNPFANET